MYGARSRMVPRGPQPVARPCSPYQTSGGVPATTISATLSRVTFQAPAMVSTCSLGYWALNPSRMAGGCCCTSPTRAMTILPERAPPLAGAAPDPLGEPVPPQAAASKDHHPRPARGPQAQPAPGQTGRRRAQLRLSAHVLLLLPFHLHFRTLSSVSPLATRARSQGPLNSTARQLYSPVNPAPGPAPSPRRRGGAAGGRPASAPAAPWRGAGPGAPARSGPAPPRRTARCPAGRGRAAPARR